MEKKRFMRRRCTRTISWEKVLYGRQWNQVLEAQWRQLPDYVAQETNAIVIADVSGSMSGRPATSCLLFTLQSGTGALTTIFS